MPDIGNILAEGGAQPSGPPNLGATLTVPPPEVQNLSSTIPQSSPAGPPGGGDFSLLRLSPEEVQALEGPLQALQQAFPNLHISRDRQGAFLLIPAKKQQEFLEIASEAGFDPSILQRIESGGSL